MAWSSFASCEGCPVPLAARVARGSGARSETLTLDTAAENLDLLETDKWLSKRSNVRLVRLEFRFWCNEGTRTLSFSRPYDAKGILLHGIICFPNAMRHARVESQLLAALG